MAIGILLVENHFKVFERKPLGGVLLKLVWLLGTMLIVMAYHGNLKVGQLNKMPLRASYSVFMNMIWWHKRNKSQNAK